MGQNLCLSSTVGGGNALLKLEEEEEVAVSCCLWLISAFVLTYKIVYLSELSGCVQLND